MKRISALPYLLLCALFASCAFAFTNPGKLTTVTKQVESYTALDLNGSFDYYLTNDSSHQIKIVAGKNIIPSIEMKVENGTLTIASKHALHIFNDTQGVKIYIPALAVNTISLDGSGDVENKGFTLNRSKMDINLNGSGDIDLSINSQKLNIALNGSGDVDIKGNVQYNSVNLSGSGDIDLLDLKTDSAKVVLAGSGDVDIFANKQLDVIIAGSGDVEYKGNPTINQTITGSGSIKKSE